MLSLTVPSCPICYSPHSYTNVTPPEGEGEISLVCATFGDSFPVTLQITVAQVLPMRRTGRQSAFSLSALR